MPNFSLELPFHEVLSSGERYVLLARLSEYYKFVSDNGKLRRYLFDSNVRDFMGLNRVNEDMKLTLEDNNSPDFWWLNNGITILATSASVIGKSIQLQDIQIVNGLQTTESIFRHFESNGLDRKNRSVLVKVIVSNEDADRDKIIRATNNQTNVELSSLHATDKIQRDIEDILGRNGFYYERRKNYYQNLGYNSEKIVSPLYLASGFVNLILKSPYKATSLKSRFMRSEKSYNVVFSGKIQLSVWPKIAHILKLVDRTLGDLKSSNANASKNFIKRWRHITSFIVVSKLLGKFDFTALDLASLSIDSITSEEVIKVWSLINSEYPNVKNFTGWRKRSFYIELCEMASKYFAIKNVERVEKIGSLNESTTKKYTKADESPTVSIDMDFALKVNALLPPQPWRPGANKLVIKELGCSNRQYALAVAMLIDEGLRHRQQDGIVYDPDGNVICFDQDRVDPESIDLLED